MSYHDNPRIDAIMLGVINDGRGTDCGYSYDRRLSAAMFNDLCAFQVMANKYDDYAHKAFDMPRASHAERTEAGDLLLAYYVRHLEEFDPDALEAMRAKAGG